MKYRAEIDGLRALAVIPVILFHAEFEIFSGGFVGVDVFFVISGYLITTIIIDDLKNKRFSIFNFYERRARRILPTLFFVMLVCMPFAWMWMLPSQMRDFSQSLVAVSLFASNVLFWRESGYFSAAAETKPLLHTWSLAVEEQYYVLFPIFLLLAWRFGKHKVFWMIVLMATISLLLSEWGWRNDATANFYLAPTRAWELFAGSIAAFIVQKHGVQKHNPLALLGLAAVVCSIFLYDESTPFPSIYALAPVLGVVLLILYADKETFAARILGTRALVGIGLISYSAYLWHQPLFAFARIRGPNHPGELLMLSLSVISLILAFFSWKFIEKPFRQKNGFSQKYIFGFSGIGLVTFLAVGFAGHFEKFKSRYTVETFAGWRDTNECVVTHADDFENSKQRLLGRCLGEKNNFILLGDSHAEALSLSLRHTIERRDGNFLSLIVNACLPVLGTSRTPIQEECVRSKKDYWQFIEKTNATVILSSRWRLYLIGSRFDNGEGGIELGANGLNTVSGSNRDIFSHTENFIKGVSRKRRVIIISQIPEAGWNVPVRKAKLQSTAEITTSYNSYVDANERVIQLFERLALKPNINVLNVEKLVCNTLIEGRCMNTIDGFSLYSDDDHPSPLLSKLIANQLSTLLHDEWVEQKRHHGVPPENYGKNVKTN